MDDPVTFRKWNHDVNAATDERVRVEGVRSLGSLPELSSERINLLLDVCIASPCLDLYSMTISTYSPAFPSQGSTHIVILLLCTRLFHVRSISAGEDEDPEHVAQPSDGNS